MAVLVELLEVCFPLARGGSVRFLASTSVVAAAQEDELAALLHVVVEHGAGDSGAVYPKLQDHFPVVLPALLEGPVVVGRELERVLACSLVSSLSTSCVGVLTGWGDWVQDGADSWDEGEGLDAAEYVALDGIAVQDGIVGNAKPAFFEVVVEGGGDKALDLGWEVRVVGASEVGNAVFVLVGEVAPVCDEQSGEASWTQVSLGDGAKDGQVLGKLAGCATDDVGRLVERLLLFFSEVLGLRRTP